MASSVFFNGVQYTLPSHGDTYSWDDFNGLGVNAFFAALATQTLQLQGGTFTLTADADFGATFGLKSAYVISKTASAASAGYLRLANADSVKWRNAANSGDLALAPGAQNQLQFNGVDVTGHPQAIYTTAAGQSITAGTAVVVNFATLELDTASAVTTGAGNWHFTTGTNKGGTYLVTAAVAFQAATGATATLLQVFKNGTAVKTLWRSSGVIPAATTLEGQAMIALVPGDLVDIRVTVTTTAQALTTSALENYVCISRLGS